MAESDSPLLYPLKPWQKEAADAALSVPGGRYCIFDTVGIGKTVEALAATCSKRLLRQKCKVLLVVEGATLKQWVAEIKKFTGFSAYNMNEASSSVARKAMYSRFASAQDGYLILNYGKTRVDYDQIVKLDYDFIIFDEAAILSNENKTSEHCRWLCRGRENVLALTATPITRDLSQFYNLFKTIGFVPMEFFTFRDNFCIVEKAFTKIRGVRRSIMKITGAQNFDQLKAVYSPYYIRRSKKDIAHLVQEVEKCYHYLTYPMTKLQNDMYDEAKKGLITTMKAGDTKEQKTALNPLSAYTAIAQILDSPHLLNTNLPTESPKLDGLIEILPRIAGEQAVIYTRYVAFGNLTKDRLKLAGFEAVFIHGQQDPKQRQDDIEAFQQGKVQFLIMTDYGQCGLNLQNASNVFFMDVHPSPAAIFQIIGRVDRVGQEAPFINVFFLMMDSSMEERRMIFLRDRQQIFDSVFDEAQAGAFNFSFDELKAII